MFLSMLESTNDSHNFHQSSLYHLVQNGQLLDESLGMDNFSLSIWDSEYPWIPWLVVSYFSKSIKFKNHLYIYVAKGWRSSLKYVWYVERYVEGVVRRVKCQIPSKYYYHMCNFV